MIRFSRYIWVYVFISSLVLIPGMVSLVVRGLRPAIDFSGGTLVELKVKSGTEKTFIENKGREAKIEFSVVQKSGENSYLLRTKDESDSRIPSFIDALNREASDTAKLVRRETVGPVLGRELLVKAIVAATLAVLAILAYVAYAFKNIYYGVAAVIALIHDVAVIIGSFSLFGVFLGVEVDTLFVTAVLTTMSFSVHDTIVVFDRIREYERKNYKSSFGEIVDRALTETMGRSLANSMTIILMLVALVIISTDNIRWFAVALLIGTLSGTYSSPFVATPILLLIRRWRRR